VNTELERLWKNALTAKFAVLFSHLAGRAEENLEKPVRKTHLRANI
jgi:hypothetical protein